MERRQLGTSGLEVSAYCLGTMTWGTQTDAAGAHAQIDRALDAGITFLDTAEVYPTTPRSAATYGRTEEILGDWIAQSGRRHEIVLATKIGGPNPELRDGRGIRSDTLRDAVEGSLRRLRTDVIDLYQLHWPMRPHYHFRRIWDYAPEGQDRAEVEANMAGVLDMLGRLQREGKIREVGLSNETAWGTAQWLKLASDSGGPRMVSIQNEYSLLCRSFDADLAELAAFERVSLLSYSPLAAGLLTGKYAGGAIPQGSRAAINGTLGGRMTERAGAAVAAYDQIARDHGLDLVHMALAWVAGRPFTGSVIFGAVTMEQLERILGAVDTTLAPEVLTEIGAAHRAHPMPY